MKHVMIQIRNVPGEMHRRLKSRAALAGMSMSEYVLRELAKHLERPTREELLYRIAEQESVDPSPSPAEIIREERECR
jgi:plasmid stability protein